ncbi:hypothetical protein DVH24_011425 [Malus domestica]|uniref:Uncharacterized protein n=1 Tax=Malus domestica TaxID=3750 RepID=A0A498JUE9_MALDO|nr:hypothetical protein DVH24_011425 [Malus domestica]
MILMPQHIELKKLGQSVLACAGLVLACAELHNFLRKECRSDEFPIEPEDDESEDEENDDELGNQTQEQQRQIANAWRAGIATNMWTDAMSDSIQR